MSFDILTAVVSSRSSDTISTPIKPQAQTPPSTLATSLTEDVLMAGMWFEQLDL